MLRSLPVGAVFFGWCTLMAVAPIRRPFPLGVLSWICSAVPNELPYVFLLIVVASAAPNAAGEDLASPAAWIRLGLALVTSAGLIVVARRALLAGRSLTGAMATSLGPDWRTEIDPAVARRFRRHLPWARILFVPWPFRPHVVERSSNIRYGVGGRNNMLDVYRHRSHPSGAPTLIYLHGGGFRWGSKRLEARPLIYRLASQGWTCICANYHLSSSPAEGFPEHLVDVKRVIAWIREHCDEYGSDPYTIFIAGSSAGAHLTAMAALTANDPTFQPGFEAADTTVRAGIGLYGYYGSLGGESDLPSSPFAYVGLDAPPIFVIHGGNDTLTPAEVSRRLVEHVRAASSNPAVYAELPGAQHSFDLFHSVRFESVVDAIEAFAGWVRTGSADYKRRTDGTRSSAPLHPRGQP